VTSKKKKSVPKRNFRGNALQEKKSLQVVPTKKTWHCQIEIKKENVRIHQGTHLGMGSRRRSKMLGTGTPRTFWGGQANGRGPLGKEKSTLRNRKLPRGLGSGARGGRRGKNSRTNRFISRKTLKKKKSAQAGCPPSTDGLPAGKDGEGVACPSKGESLGGGTTAKRVDLGVLGGVWGWFFCGGFRTGSVFGPM